MLNGLSTKTRKTILVVEADESLRECLFEILAMEGYHVAIVQNVTEGLLFLETKNLPSLIIFALTKPEPSDWAFLREVRENAKLRAIPIILSSAVVDEKALELAMGIISKPYDMQTLLEAVSHYIQS